MPLFRLTNISKDRETRMERKHSPIHPRLRISNVFLRPGHSVDLPLSVIQPYLPEFVELEKGFRIRISNAETGEQVSVASLLAECSVVQAAPEPPAAVSAVAALNDALDVSGDDVEEPAAAEEAVVPVAEVHPEPDPVPMEEELLPPLEPVQETPDLPAMEDLPTLLGKKQAELEKMCQDRGLPVRATDNKTKLAKRLLGLEV